MKRGFIIIRQKQKSSRKCSGPGESAPKKAKTVPSAGKIMATIFQDSYSIILIDYSHYDNAPAHMSAIATAKLIGLRCEILPHPPYSTDLALSDYFFFPNMITWLRGKTFSSNEEIIAATNEYFEGFDKNYFLEGTKKLEYRYNKCIQLKGDYLERKIGIFVIKSVLHFKVTDSLNNPRTRKFNKSVGGPEMALQITSLYFPHVIQSFRWHLLKFKPISLFTSKLYMIEAKKF